MPIFNKQTSQLTTADLAELLQDSAVEGVRLEFKSNVPDKDETLKKLSSFANTFGGWMVIGAKANSSDGRIQDLSGVDQQPGYKQKVVQWCFDGTSPPLIVEVSDAIPAPGGSGKFCYVIHTAESDVAPHFVNGRKGVWVRSDEFSQRYEPQLATENEIRHLLDRRSLVDERRTKLLQRSRRRFDTFLSRKVTDVLPRLEVSFGPRFPARPVCDQARLATVLPEVRVSWRQTSFPYGSANCVSQHESVLLIKPPKDARNRAGIVEANIWGLLFYGNELETEVGPAQDSFSGIHLYQLVGYLLVFAEHAKRMISLFGYEGPLAIEVTMKAILGVPWLHAQDSMGMYRGPASELDDEFSFVLQRQQIVLESSVTELC